MIYLENIFRLNNILKFWQWKFVWYLALKFTDVKTWICIRDMQYLITGRYDDISWNDGSLQIRYEKYFRIISITDYHYIIVSRDYITVKILLLVQNIFCILTSSIMTSNTQMVHNKWIKGIISRRISRIWYIREFSWALSRYIFHKL